MSKRGVPSWQVVLSDLALILFLTTLAAQASLRQQSTATTRPSPQASELAVYRPGAGGLSLRQWLAEQPRDARRQLTVAGRYRPEAFDRITGEARALAQQAALAGHAPRVLIEPGAHSEVIVSFAYDAPPDQPAAADSTRLRPASLAR